MAPRVLVTAGGTRVPIDEVRWIGNGSTGRFGADIVRACLDRGAAATHLVAKHAARPFVRTVDAAGDLESQWAECQQLAAAARSVGDRLHSVEYSTFDEYADQLERLLTRDEYDIVFLAAAVSDYAPLPAEGKLSSDADDLAIRMRRLPKLIGRVKEWAPTIYLVGFKLLAGADHADLIAAALRSCEQNHADVVVANDWRSLTSGHHAVHLVRQGQPAMSFAAGSSAGDFANPAEFVVHHVLRWHAERKKPT